MLKENAMPPNEVSVAPLPSLSFDVGGKSEVHIIGCNEDDYRGHEDARDDSSRGECSSRNLRMHDNTRRNKRMND